MGKVKVKGGGLHDTQPRTSQHRHGCFGYHGHVDHRPVTLLQLEGMAEHSGEGLYRVEDLSQRFITVQFWEMFGFSERESEGVGKEGGGTDLFVSECGRRSLGGLWERGDVVEAWSVAWTWVGGCGYAVSV